MYIIIYFFIYLFACTYRPMYVYLRNTCMYLYLYFFSCRQLINACIVRINHACEETKQYCCVTVPMLACIKYVYSIVTTYFYPYLYSIQHSI